ncbi:hypothetical protein CHS0354_018312 [Potamilus streckersoni]|uniref:TNFR-Cys domain-containing protein n=1 Tax=Potamilus streckersoni TaxID=2493646 RepID=A0AAE0TL68_9BIVA|nr:hypothetical protein CHS0354_018312 [Potamilus streckersoni]
MNTSHSIFLAWCVLLLCTRRAAEGEQGEDVPDQKPVTDRRLCSEGEFYDTDAMVCTMCSECPENLIVLRVCSDRLNTFCGPFPNFKFKSSMDSGTYTVLKSDREEEEEEMTPKTTKASQMEHLQSGTWYTISLVLLGILSVLFLFLTFFVVVTCYICKHRRQDKEYSYNSVASEVRFRANEQTTDERYIRDPTTPRHVPARERLKPSIEAGGEDIAGPSHVLVPPTGVRESPDPDPDNGAQSGSAEYVYIKKVKVMHTSPFDVV